MRDYGQTTIAISRKREARLNVPGGEIRKVVEHFGDGHAAAKIIKNIGYRDACSADAGLPAADAWVNRNALPIIHMWKISAKQRFGKSDPRAGDCLAIRPRNHAQSFFAKHFVLQTMRPPL